MSNFQWPPTWPKAGDRVECLFERDWYAGVVKSTRKSDKAMRLWFNDTTKHTWKLTTLDTWKIKKRKTKRKVSLFFCAPLACARISHICFACAAEG